MSIMPGYLLKITTWENDADNYNTKEIAGLSRSEAIFLIKVCQLFKSCNQGGKYDIWWPGQEPSTYQRKTDEGMVEDIMTFCDTYRVQEWGLIPEGWNWRQFETNGVKIEDVARDYYNELLYDLGLGSWADGEYRRVFESFKVLRVPEVIQDVTDEFKGIIDG